MATPVANAPDEFGMGVAIPQSDAVYASDVPPQAPSFTPAPTRSLPMASAPSSRRFSSTRPEFIFTNPAAAQQAAHNYAARLGFEAGQDQGYRDYLSRLEADNAANQRANVQAQIYGNQLTAAGQEGAAMRASNERIAGMSAAIRQYQSDEARWQDNERNRRMGEGYAETLNRDPNARVDRRYIQLNPQTGRWESIFKEMTRPVPPQFSAPTTGAQARATMVTAPFPQPSPLPPSAPVMTAPAIAGGAPAAPIMVPDPGPAPMIDIPPDLGPPVASNPFPRNAISSVMPAPAPSFALPQARSRDELIRFLTSPQ